MAVNLSQKSKIQMRIMSCKRIAMLRLLVLEAELKRVRKRTRLVKDLKVKAAVVRKRIKKMLRKRKKPLWSKLGDLLVSFARRLSKIMAHSKL